MYVIYLLKGEFSPCSKKIAHVAPIYKTGDEHVFSNYCPEITLKIDA